MKDSLSEIYPEITKEWHPTLNGELTPENVSYSSNKIIWWKCDKETDHIYKMAVYNKIKEGCACCNNRQIVLSNCLATIYPEIAKEWHPFLNGELTPYNVSPRSHKKVWWICELKNHEWESSIANRLNRNCPYCARQKVCEDTCLSTTHPEIAKQWHPFLNGELTPNDVLSGSARSVWWQCEKETDHVYKMNINNKLKQNCACCERKQVVLSNCLSTTNSEIANQWHPFLNKDLTPYHITAGSGKKVWWLCPDRQHAYMMTVTNRTCLKQTCPYCSNQRVCEDNCLATTHPNLLNEWNYTKNVNFTPHDVVAGSEKKAWWTCEHGHEWKTTISNRALSNTNCPICNNSKGEIAISKILKKYNIEYLREVRISACKNKRPLPFDFSITLNKLFLIEFQGIQHYEHIQFGGYTVKDRLDKIQINDKIKFDYCRNNDIPLLVIPYWNYDNIENLLIDFLKINTSS